MYLSCHTTHFRMNNHRYLPQSRRTEGSNRIARNPLARPFSSLQKSVPSSRERKSFPISRSVELNAHSTSNQTGSEAQNVPSSPSPGPNGFDFTVSRRNLVLIGSGLGTLSTLSLGGRRALAQELASSEADAELLSKALGLENRVTDFTLSNGLRFVVFERHSAPVVSCYTFADVGAYDEVDGQTGVAHLLEHLAFKGTTSVGGRDFEREAPLLDALDEAFYAMREAEEGGRAAEAARLQQQLTALMEQADQFVVPNEFGNLLENEGAVGLNAQTSQDETVYYCALPRNKLELWFALEAERFANPVFRQLYKEKEVVLNERRLRVELPPLGLYQETFALRALQNNYRRPVIGFEADIRALGRREVDHFFRSHYGPSKLVIALVGDVRPSEVRTFAERYFGGWAMAPSALPAPPPVPPNAGRTTREIVARLEAGQEDPRLLKWESPAGPLFMDGYGRPPSTDDDSLAIEFLIDILGGGRTARLYSNLVLTGKALNTTALPSYPGERAAGLVLTYGTPGPALGADPARLARAFRDECRQLADAGNIQERELRRVKKSARASLLEAVLSNTSMASYLSEYTVRTGSWRGLERDLDRIGTLTARDLARVAGDVFGREENRFSGLVVKPGKAGDQLGGAAGGLSLSFE